MRSLQYYKVALLIFALISCTNVQAQQDYLVLVKGDTIKGKVKYLNFANAKNVQVTPEGSKKKVFGILEVKSFHLNQELYLNIRTLEGYTFMKLLKSGYLSFYAYQLPNQSTWDGRYLQKKDGSGVDLPNIGFKKILSRYLSDCEEVANDIETKELTKSKLDLIIDQYNLCIESRSQKKDKVAIQETPAVSSTSVDRWKELESSISKMETLEGKENAVEIINDIKLKVLRNEKVSNFLINGLKESLANQPQIKTLLDAALQTLSTKE